MVTTLGVDDKGALRPLAVDFHEPGLCAGLAQEDAFTQERGFWFQLGWEDKQQAKVGWGPGNAQALNRYSYVLNNPVRYTDPSGHHYDENWAPGGGTGYSRVCNDGQGQTSCDNPGASPVRNASGAYLYYTCVQFACKYVWGDDPAWGNLRGSIDSFISNILYAGAALGVTVVGLGIAVATCATVVGFFACVAEMIGVAMLAGWGYFYIWQASVALSKAQGWFSEAQDVGPPLISSSPGSGPTNYRISNRPSLVPMLGPPREWEA